MKAVIQRVSEALVEINRETYAAIGPGLLILVGIKNDDTENEARWLADKCANLRIFQDEQGRMNRSVSQINGEILVVSQFTVYGETEKGRRPSFSTAAPPEHSEPLYLYFTETLRRISGLNVETGKFGAEMKVRLTNDGPVTLLVEKEKSHSKNQGEKVR